MSGKRRKRGEEEDERWLLTQPLGAALLRGGGDLGKGFATADFQLVEQALQEFEANQEPVQRAGEYHCAHYKGGRDDDGLPHGAGRLHIAWQTRDCISPPKHKLTVSCDWDHGAPIGMVRLLTHFPGEVGGGRLELHYHIREYRTPWDKEYYPVLMRHATMLQDDNRLPVTRWELAGYGCKVATRVPEWKQIVELIFASNSTSRWSPRLEDLLVSMLNRSRGDLDAV